MQCSRISTYFNNSPLQLFFILGLVLLIVNELTILEIVEPQIVTLGISGQCDLILFELGELDILQPIVVIEWEVLEEDSQ